MNPAATLWLGRIRRGLRKPPAVIASRVKAELLAELERFYAPRRDRLLDRRRLLNHLHARSLSELWERLASTPALVPTGFISVEDYERLCPGDADRILAAAENALAHEVDLLGSGPVALGEQIDWHKDYKTGFSWPVEFFRRIDYNNRNRPSDVKFPWELSRVQWLLPAGQAYLLTGDERFAEGARAVLQDWIKANPYGYGVNWAVAMEVALRIISWIWLFQVFAGSRAWDDEQFRVVFLRALYLHADFTERHLERSDINGNHYTANAAGLVISGLFFDAGSAPKRWASLGWQVLCEELPRQVYPDGVDFEVSTAYHRLVLELFFLSALYRGRCGSDVPSSYQARLVAMAQFTSAYSRPSGSAPFWGDADDARVLPFGGQDIQDHRYLPGVLGAAWNISDLKKSFTGPRSELFWLLGQSAVRSLPSSTKSAVVPGSTAFADGGVYVMRNGQDHVFIDCGPVGLGGRGGHGHNDCLSFEAVLDGVHLITDCGSYVYTASYGERNNFRSTRYHNTPIVDGEEINRFISPEYLWNLHYDARPECRLWQSNEEKDVFQGSHSGYERLTDLVRPVRTLLLDKQAHVLAGIDAFEGNGRHEIEIPFHLAAGISVEHHEPGRCVLNGGQRKFVLAYTSARDWKLNFGSGYLSPRYGVKIPISRLSFTLHGRPAALGWALMPEEAAQRGAQLVNELMAGVVS